MVKPRTLILAALALITLAVAATAERGTDGELRMLYWQAPSILNPYLSGGTKDIHAASLILEPLARYDENGDMVA
jgi:peptide/nickel transport system substrate-binding protein